MKKILPFLSIILVLFIIFTIFLSMAKEQKMIVVKEGNVSRIPLDIVLGKYQDSDCGMLINSLEYASQIISEEGKTWFFHDHGGMANWLNSKSFKDTALVFVMTKDTKRYIDARKAFYSVDEDTPMKYGFGAYENKIDDYIDFEELSLRVLRKQTLANPAYKLESK